ncbi:hypothetical protein BSKO_01968 [Bryopsis sp. KO-2023]|nr:hypothetical protein BSKO_01968 [Bryopsis sp. KO-2023]
MPSGLRLDTDAWHKDYEHAKQLAQDITALIQERNLKHPDGGPQGSRMTAAARRKIGSLGTATDALQDLLASSRDVTDNERNRRRDMVRALKTQRENLLQALKREQAAVNRASLLDGGVGGRAGPPRETDQTAALENHQLIGLQTQVMRQQDQELEQMEEAVHNTKHVANAINEEVDLQIRLLDNLEEEVDVVHSRMGAAAKRVKTVLTQSSECRTWSIVLLLVVVLVAVSVFAFKHLFK